MGFDLLGALGKGLDIITDFIPGANLVQSGIEAVVPQAKSFFDGTLNDTQPSYQMGPMPVATASTGGSQMSLPILQMSGGGSVPMPIQATQAAASGGAGGLPVPWWKGPGGKLQLPWNDPKIAEYLKPYALDDAYLKTYVRAPKGFVVLRDASGRPFAVQKEIAKFFGLWKPAAKPPISATDWKHYKRNKQIEKKLKKVAAPVIREARASARRSATTKKRR